MCRLLENCECLRTICASVGFVYYPTSVELEVNWLNAQGLLVEKMSEHIRRSDPKAWDGYLTLFTLDEFPNADAVARIENDTSRLRKLVATGRELKTIASVERSLLPVLPFNAAANGGDPVGLLDRIPAMLEDLGIERPLADAAIESFQQNRSPLEGIESWRRNR